MSSTSTSSVSSSNSSRKRRHEEQSSSDLSLSHASSSSSSQEEINEEEEEDTPLLRLVHSRPAQDVDFFEESTSISSTTTSSSSVPWLPSYTTINAQGVPILVRSEPSVSVKAHTKLSPLRSSSSSSSSTYQPIRVATPCVSVREACESILPPNNQFTSDQYTYVEPQPNLQHIADCTFCLFKPVNPVQPKCSCETPVCEDCIKNYLEQETSQNTICPSCRNELDSETPYQKISLHHQVFFNTLQVKCLNQDCVQVVHRDALLNHVRVCTFTKVSCKFCTWTGSELDFQNNHYPTCSELKVFCPSSCGVQIARKHVQNHCEHFCVLARSHCSQCGSFQTKKDMDTHKETECKNRLLFCKAKSIGCSFSTYNYNPEGLVSHEFCCVAVRLLHQMMPTVQQKRALFDEMKHKLLCFAKNSLVEFIPSFGLIAVSVHKSIYFLDDQHFRVQLVYPTRGKSDITFLGHHLLSVNNPDLLILYADTEDKIMFSYKTGKTVNFRPQSLSSASSTYLPTLAPLPYLTFEDGPKNKYSTFTIEGDHQKTVMLLDSKGEEEGLSFHPIGPHLIQVNKTDHYVTMLKRNRSDTFSFDTWFTWFSNPFYAILELFVVHPHLCIVKICHTNHAARQDSTTFFRIIEIDYENRQWKESFHIKCLSKEEVNSIFTFRISQKDPSTVFAFSTNGFVYRISIANGIIVRKAPFPYFCPTGSKCFFSSASSRVASLSSEEKPRFFVWDYEEETTVFHEHYGQASLDTTSVIQFQKDGVFFSCDVHKNKVEGVRFQGNSLKPTSSFLLGQSPLKHQTIPSFSFPQDISQMNVYDFRCVENKEKQTTSLYFFHDNYASGCVSKWNLQYSAQTSAFFVVLQAWFGKTEPKFKQVQVSADEAHIVAVNHDYQLRVIVFRHEDRSDFSAFPLTSYETDLVRSCSTIAFDFEIQKLCVALNFSENEDNEEGVEYCFFSLNEEPIIYKNKFITPQREVKDLVFRSSGRGTESTFCLAVTHKLGLTNDIYFVSLSSDPHNHHICTLKPVHLPFSQNLNLETKVQFCPRVSLSHLLLCVFLGGGFCVVDTIQNTILFTQEATCSNVFFIDEFTIAFYDTVSLRFVSVKHLVFGS